jgi:curved DNA-binding protein CbpA
MRSFASVHDANPSQGKRHNNSNSPSWPTSATPTPYEILGLSRDAPYTKARYFELAKLYHPDRQRHTSADGISRLTKLERYRQVVAAHEILSNPQKRRMYDLYGFGWDNQGNPRTRYRETDRAWRHEPGNPSMNATWEDWERWYQERDGKGEKQEEVFTSNLGFMAIISLFLVIGTWAQMTRAGTNSVSLLEMRDQNHAAISRELRQRQSQRAGLDREGRIENFLRQQELEKWAYDAPGHGLPAPGGTSASETHARPTK